MSSESFRLTAHRATRKQDIVMNKLWIKAIPVYHTRPNQKFTKKTNGKWQAWKTGKCPHICKGSPRDNTYKYAQLTKAQHYTYRVTSLHAWCMLHPQLMSLTIYVFLLHTYLLIQTQFVLFQVEHRATSCLHLAWSLAVSLESLQSTPIISKLHRKLFLNYINWTAFNLGYVCWQSSLVWMINCTITIIFRCFNIVLITARFPFAGRF